ncbi:MAG: YjgN family protein [Burkholderiaceae bacterium]|nr:YjgN family protein [Burkholderiaceae bacterium]
MDESVLSGGSPDRVTPVAATELAPTLPTANETTAAPAHRYPLRFTGSGSEYFRIWIVNLLLTIVTVGIYSAWAKVRKLQYFYRNTRLDEAAFDFHGDPKKILLGRIIALALFVGYNFAFQLSPAAALVAVAAAIVAAPWLVRRAIQFKHSNSSYRGLRFGFAGTSADATRALGPTVALITLPGALTALTQLSKNELLPWFAVLASLALLCLYPLMHFWFKRFHHDNARYATLAGRFTADWDDFYVVYLPLVLIFIGWAFMFGLGMALVFGAVGKPGREPNFVQLAAIFATALLAYGLLLATVAPFMVTRLQNLVWSKTRLGEISFDSRLRMWPIAALYLKNAVLVALTLGLYWPWAVVAVARHRLQSVEVASSIALSELAGQLEAGSMTATGDAAADVFGFEIGL